MTVTTKTLVSAVVAAAMLALSAPAAADRMKIRKRAATAGEEVLIGVHTSVNKRCRARKAPVIEIVKAPALGEVVVRPTPRRLNRPGRKCHGRVVRGAGIYYRPRVGAVGADDFTYRRLRARTPSTRYTVVLRVNPAKK